MHSTLRPYVTAGAVIVGAGLIAITPMAAPLPHINTVRDVALTAGPGGDAFTIDGTTFDPFTGSGATATEGFDPVPALSTAPPLLSLGGGWENVGPIHLPLAPQSFDVYSGTGSSATDLGSIDTNQSVANLLGLPNTEFTVTGATPADGVDASGLPTTGTVYDVLNLGGGTYNVYVATPDVGSTSGTVTDTLVTPSGNTDLSSLFGNINAANPLQPGDAFTGLHAGDSAGGADAFTIGDTTFDPFTGSGASVAEGFTPVHSLAGVPPLLNLGGGTLYLNTNPPPPAPWVPLTFANQDFDIYSGTGSNATELGSINTAEYVTNLLGLTNTQFIVKTATPADGVDASELPTNATVYDVFNLGNGYSNVYTATPDVGNTPGTVTDTLVTPNGDINLDSLFGGINAANWLDPGDALTGLQAGDASIGADAFTLGGYIFDPFTGSGDSTAEGFYTVPPLFSAAPLLNLGGAQVHLSPTFSFPEAPQDFDVYSGTGSEVGSISTSENVGNVLGLTNTAFTVLGVTPTGDATDADLPTVGSVYNVLNLGSGWENIYIATPDVGSTSGTVTDTLVTPYGNVDLSSLFGTFNAANPFDPGDAVTGLDFGSATDADPLAFLGL